MRENTVFRIASISKSFTSLLVGRLLDQKKLTVDDDVRTYVPEFPQKMVNGKYVSDASPTIYFTHLLCHKEYWPGILVCPGVFLLHSLLPQLSSRI